MSITANCLVLDCKNFDFYFLSKFCPGDCVSVVSVADLVDVVTLPGERLVPGTEGPVQLTGVVLHAGGVGLQGGGLGHRVHRQVRQAELQLLPELGLSPPDHRAGLEVEPQLRVQLPLHDVTDYHEDRPLAGSSEGGVEAGPEVVSAPLLLEEAVREDHHGPPGSLAGVHDGVSHVLRGEEVAVVQTDLVLTGPQLQLWGHQLPDKPVVHQTVDDEHVKYFVSVHLIVLHPLEESDAVLVVQPDSHLVPVEEDQEDEDHEDNEGDEGSEDKGKIVRDYPGLDVTAGHLPRLLTIRPVVFEVLDVRLGDLIAHAGHHLGVVHCRPVALQPGLEPVDVDTVAGPEVLHQSH